MEGFRASEPGVLDQLNSSRAFGNPQISMNAYLTSGGPITLPDPIFLTPHLPFPNYAGQFQWTNDRANVVREDQYTSWPKLCAEVNSASIARHQWDEF